MLQYATVVRYVLEYSVYRGSSVLRCDVFRSTTHLDEGLQENFNPGVNGGTECFRELLNQQAAVGGHGRSERVGNLEYTVQERLDACNEGRMELMRCVALENTSQLGAVLISSQPIPLALFSFVMRRHVAENVV